ncbi:MAG: nuclease-related domain-containing protein [Methylophilaceae bacterium]
MILKEKQLTNSTDPKLKAGEDAEKQMAFYLGRVFGKEKDCFVLNDLRITHKDDTAQVDHLIITRFGLFIIESKSVHGEISVNKHKEWTRTYMNKSQGMASPILQAEAQGRVLKDFIRENRELLLGKMLFGTTQKGFKFCPVFIYVAISDTGIIERKTDIPELLKADQVSQAISEKLKLSF